MRHVKIYEDFDADIFDIGTEFGVLDHTSRIAKAIAKEFGLTEQKNYWPSEFKKVYGLLSENQPEEDDEEYSGIDPRKAIEFIVYNTKDELYLQINNEKITKKYFNGFKGYVEHFKIRMIVHEDKGEVEFLYFAAYNDLGYTVYEYNLKRTKHTPSMVPATSVQAIVDMASSTKNRHKLLHYFHEQEIHGAF